MGVVEILRRWLRGGSVDAMSGLDPAQTKLVVGLGNPGPEYADTRHNLGFRCVELVARRNRAAWQDKTGLFQALIAVSNNTSGESLVIARPQTFMNRSGKCVRDLIEFLKLPPSQALIVYDDMDLPFGKLRLREQGSAGTHNGMRSVVTSLQTEDIPRLRLGIGQSSPGEATSHVLGEFTLDEQAAVDELVARAADAVEAWGEHGAVSAMNRYNKT